MQPKPEKKEETKPVKKEEVKRKSLDIPEATQKTKHDGLNDIGGDITVAEYVAGEAKKEMEKTHTSVANSNNQTQIDEETFYLLLYKPSGQESETTCFHPLFEMYEHLLNDVLPSYENVNTQRECMQWMERHLGILTQEWQ